jgi:hypothetical protein
MAMKVPKVSCAKSATCSLHREKSITQSAYIVKRDSGEEVLVVVVTSSSPEVANLLGLDILDLKRRALERRGRRLENR